MIRVFGGLTPAADENIIMMAVCLIVAYLSGSISPAILHLASLVPHEVREQSLKRHDLYVGQVYNGLTCHHLAFFDAEHGLFFGIDEDRDDEFVKDRCTALCDIEMPVCERIERSRVHGSDQRFPSSSPPRW